MRQHIKSTFYYFTALLILLVSMPGSAVITPAYAAGTLTVLNTNDSGTGSLRQAILDAAAGDTITFDTSLSGATIRLQATTTDSLVVDKNLTIDGSALATPITISGDSDNNGAGDVRVFVISSGVTVTLKSLIITKGSIGSAGAGIYNNGTLTLMNCTVSNNVASDKGGGIYSLGTLTLSGSTVSNNMSNDNGGGIAAFFGALNVTNNSTISGNSGLTGGGIWVGLDTNPGDSTISNSTISNNTSLSDGGGIYDISRPLTITNSTLSGNSSTAGNGGAIYGNVTLTGSTLSGNSTPSGSGAGIYSGNSTITNSTLSGNIAAYDAGGIDSGSFSTVAILGSTLSGNQAGSNSYGGAIFNHNAATTTLTNSTLSGNKAGYGGGIENQSGGIVNLMSVTMSGNQATNTGGIGGLANLGELNFVNTIIANSTEGDCDYFGAATIPIRSAIIVQDGHCYSAAIDDVKLGPLANNGGPTKTHALLAGSPAIDAGDNSYCDDNPGANNLDQRGYARPVDGDAVPGAVCDIGAYELQLPPVYLPLVLR